MGVDILLKKINKFAEDAKNVKLNEEQIYTIFNAIKKTVDSRREIVPTEQAVFQNQSKVAGHYESPVCMIDVATAKPSENWLYFEPALIIRFGTFPEQPYDDANKQMNYALKLLEGRYNKNNFYLERVEKIASGEGRSITRNSNYNNQYIALFYKE